jgi:hypothetical protein
MKLRFILSLCILFTLTGLKATHILGGHIRNESLGSGKYVITATIYRDCQSQFISLPNFGVYAGTNGSNACGSYSLSGMARVSIREVTPRCSTLSEQCKPSNTAGTGLGVEEHVYKCTVDLNKSPISNFNKTSCCDITFYVSFNFSINPYNANSSSGTFVLLQSMNLCNLKKVPRNNGENSSPLYTGDASYLITTNIAHYEALGAIDTVDYDSLSFRLEKMRSAIPSGVYTYPSPYTKRYFITPKCKTFRNVTCTPDPNANPPVGIYFDSSTGDIVFTPTIYYEQGWRYLETDEYRQDSSGKWLKIGMSSSAVAYNTIDGYSYNNAPVISSNRVHSLCAGDKICFNISVKDTVLSPWQTIPDTVLVTWDGAIPGAQFKVLNPNSREKVAEFCWQTKPEHEREHAWRFSVTATDQNCPMPVKSSRTFSIYVRKKIVADTPKIQVVGCNKIIVNSSAESVSNQKVSWLFLDSSGKKLSESKKSKDTVVINYVGKVYVKQRVANWNCIYERTDSVSLTPTPAISLGKDTHVCYHTRLNIQPNIGNAIKPYKYSWRIKNNDSFSNTDSVIVLNVSRDTSVLLMIEDSKGCASADTLQIFTMGHTRPIVVKTLPPFCYRDKALELSSYFEMPGKQAETDSVFSGYTGVYQRAGEWEIHPSNFPKKELISGAFKSFRSYVSYTDTNACAYLDSFLVDIAGNPAFVWKDTVYCLSGDVLTLSNLVELEQETNSTYWRWRMLSAPKAALDSFVLDTANLKRGKLASIKSRKSGNPAFYGYYKFALHLVDSSTGCVYENSNSINIKQVQELKVMTEPKFCAMNNSISLLSNIQLNGRRAKTNEVAFSVYRFNGDKNHANTGTNYITNDTLFTGSEIPGIWGMRAKAQEPACETEVFWNIDVLRKPQARFVLSPDSVVTLPPGLFASTNLSTPDSSKLGRWVWYTPGAVTDSTVRWEPNIAYDGVGNYEIRLFLIDSSGCFDTFAQSVRVGYNISVFDVAEMDIALFPNPTSGELNIVGAQIGGFRLYNAQGILVTKGEFSESRLSLEDYDAGVYMLQLEVNGARYSYKLQLNP